MIDAQDPAWLAAAGGSATSINFAGLPVGSTVTDQFASSGAIFTQSGVIQDNFGAGPYMECPAAFGTHPPQPNEGLRVSFASPMRALSLGLLCIPGGSARVELRRAGQIVWWGNVDLMDGGWDGASWHFGFAGLVSDQDFDAIWVAARPEVNWPGAGPTTLYAQSLSFSPVPAPGAFPLLLATALTATRRRRS